MIQTLCDRCGKEVKEVDNELYFTKIKNTKYGYDKCIHLCNKCLKEIDKFMLNKTKPQEKNLMEELI